MNIFDKKKPVVQQHQARTAIKEQKFTKNQVSNHEKNEMKHQTNEIEEEFSQTFNILWNKKNYLKQKIYK